MLRVAEKFALTESLWNRYRVIGTVTIDFKQ